MAHVLFTTPVLRHPPNNGPSLRIENSIKALSSVSELSVIARAAPDTAAGKAAQDFYKGYAQDFLWAPSAQSPLLKLPYMRAFSPFISVIQHRAVIRDCKFIERYMRDHSIDVLWCGFGNISFDLIRQIKADQPHAKIVCDTDSVWSWFILRELPYEKSPLRRVEINRAGQKKEREESALVNLADATTAVSAIEADYYRSLAKDPARIKLFSNVIDIHNYAFEAQRAAKIQKPCICLTGSFWPRSPMHRATLWFVDEVMPIVRRTIPSAQVYVVGAGSKRTVKYVGVPHVTIVGDVPTVLPYLHAADVSVVPLAFESGTRFKILEAGACCVPVVSTTLGAEGLPITHEKDILIADSPVDFANSVIRVIQDRGFAAEMAQNLHDLVRARFSIDAAAREAREVLRFLC